MSSMFLIEAAYLKKPVMSILIGLRKENPFVLDRIGYLKSIKTYEGLKSNLIDFFQNKSAPLMDLNLKHGSIDFIIKYLEENHCQN
jgi:hypothetical protein